MKLGEMYPSRFLRGQDMVGGLLIVIRGVTQEKVRAGAGRPEEAKYILRFELAKNDQQPAILPTTSHPPEGYGLVLRKILANEIFEATKTSDTSDWPACKVVILPRVEKAAGREMTVIHARAPRAQASTSNVDHSQPTTTAEGA